MDFFKVKGLRRSFKLRSSTSGGEPDRVTPERDAIPDPAPGAAGAGEEEDDDDDDFFTNEVKRRLKELRKNSFMVLIPEESCPEEEEEMAVAAEEGGHVWGGFDAYYDEYCKRMLFFSKMSALYLKEAESWNTSSQLPKSTTKKLASTLRNLSFKRRHGLQDDCEHLQESQYEDNPYQNLETAYVAQVCLTWEALHCQYMQLNQRISSQPEDSTSYCYAAQAFQQFQVLLQRFIENEPFEQGSRVEIYANGQSSLPKLLHAPSFQGTDERDENGDYLDSPIFASELLHVIEESILTFHLFVRMDKKKPAGALHLASARNQADSPLKQVQVLLDKKKVKLKELLKKKGWKKKSWPVTPIEAELLLGLIDVRVISRVLRMTRISKEQLLWCDEKISKLDLSDNKLRRDVSPILFPCQ